MIIGEAAAYANLPLWSKIIIVYLMIGFCTQLPGVVYGFFLSLQRFQNLASARLGTKIIVGILWLVYTTFFWPIPFFRAGLNIHALKLAGIGLLGGILILHHGVTEPHLIVSIGIVIAAGVFSLLAVVPRR